MKNIYIYTSQKETCYYCGGSGNDDGEICGSCSGSGQIDK